MAGSLDILGISEKEYVESEGVAKEIDFIWESGVYKVIVTGVFGYTTPSGAKMLMVNIKDDKERTQQFGFNTAYKDKKTGEMTDNKAGVATFKGLCHATGVLPSEIEVVSGKAEAYGKEVDANIFKNMINKTVQASIREIFEEGSEYERSNEVETFSNADGLNAKGENFDKFLEKIAKNPILKRKAKTSPKVEAKVNKAGIEAAKKLL